MGPSLCCNPRNTTAPLAFLKHQTQLAKMSEVSAIGLLEHAPVSAEGTPEIAEHASNRPRRTPKKRTTPAKRAVPKSHTRIGPRRRANTLRSTLRKLNIGINDAGQNPDPPQPGRERVVTREPSDNNSNDAARPVPRNTLARPVVSPGIPGEERGRNPETHQIDDDRRLGHGSLPPSQPQLHSRYRQARAAESELANNFLANDGHTHTLQPARPPNSIFGNGSQASLRHSHTPYPQPARATPLPLLRPGPSPAHINSYFTLINDDHHAPVEPISGSTLGPTPTYSTPAFPNFIHQTPANPTLTYPTFTAPIRPDAGTPTIGAAAMARVHNATIGLAFMTGTLQYPPGGRNVVIYTRPQALQDEQVDLA